VYPPGPDAHISQDRAKLNKPFPYGRAALMCVWVPGNFLPFWTGSMLKRSTAVDGHVYVCLRVTPLLRMLGLRPGTRINTKLNKPFPYGRAAWYCYGTRPCNLSSSRSKRLPEISSHAFVFCPSSSAASSLHGPLSTSS